MRRRKAWYYRREPSPGVSVIGARLMELAFGGRGKSSHEESGTPRSQDSVTGGAGGPSVSQACSALISGPGFFLDRGKARLLVKSSPQPGNPADKARSMIGLKSLTFSVSSHRLSALAHANISSSDFARRSGRSATAIMS